MGIESVTDVTVLGWVRETLGVVQLIAGIVDKLLVLVALGTLFSIAVMGLGLAPSNTQVHRHRG